MSFCTCLTVVVEAKSKRLTTRHRAKVGRKLREHHRKLNKEVKVNKNRRRKDPGIPNRLPGRAEFIAKMQAEREKEQAQRKISLARNNIQGLAAQVKVQHSRYEKNAPVSDSTIPTGERFFDSSKRAFYREFQQVLENSDVILEILDARDPLGSRVRVAEELVAASGGRKRIVLVLNKIDLVPRQAVAQWLTYLRKELPTIAFRASTATAAVGSAIGMGECLGADTLIQLLKNYCRSQDIKTSVRVGVIGYPNVGKSSLINSLKRSKVCKVGATAGVTTASQEIHLDRNITLLDCPGIVFASPRDSTEMAELFLRNCLKIEQLEDPVAPVELILSKTNPETLMTLYTIPRFHNVGGFLAAVAQRMGRLKKGGIPNIEAAAKIILGDWNRGKIPFYTRPPVSDDSGNDPTANSCSIVNDWAPLFDIEAIGRMEIDLVLRNVPETLPLTQAIDHGEPHAMSTEMDTESTTLNLALPTKSKDSVDYSIGMSTTEMELNPQRNRDRARKLKEVRKTERKASRRSASQEGQDNVDMIIEDDAYDFSVDFNK